MMMEAMLFNLCRNILKRKHVKNAIKSNQEHNHNKCMTNISVNVALVLPLHTFMLNIY